MIGFILVWFLPILSGLYISGGVLPPLFLSPDRGAGGFLREVIYGNICHQLPERSFFCGDIQLYLCARCLGFYGAIFVTSLVIALYRRRPRLSFWPALLLALPGLADAIFDLGASLAWANPLRTITGLVAGFAVAAYLYPRYLDRV